MSQETVARNGTERNGTREACTELGTVPQCMVPTLDMCGVTKHVAHAHPQLATHNESKLEGCCQPRSWSENIVDKDRG